MAAGEKRSRRHPDDIVFEIEPIKQIEINIDYILMLVKKYHEDHCQDKEVLVTIRKAVDASTELRSKKQTIIDKLKAFFDKYFGIGSSR